MPWDARDQDRLERYAEEALNAFDASASADFVSQVLRQARQQPLTPPGWLHWLTGRGVQLVPMYACLAVIIGMLLLVRVGYVEWPLSDAVTPSRTLVQSTETDETVIEVDLTRPVVAFAAGLPLYYAVHRSAAALVP